MIMRFFINVAHSGYMET